MATKRRVIVNSTSYELEVLERDGLTFARIKDQEPVRVHLERVGTYGEETWLLFLNDETHLLAASPSEDGFEITVSGRMHQVATERLNAGAFARAPQPEEHTDGGPILLKSTISGMVVDVLVKTGARVQRGETLLIVEAMKMQNEVQSPRDGIVAAIHIGPGDRVERSTPMVLIEQEPIEA